MEILDVVLRYVLIPAGVIVVWGYMIPKTFVAVLKEGFEKSE